jgi:hypothetical protein
MADLNALIAQGAQFKAPVDPFAQYAQMQQLQQGQTANQLNRMKMEEMQAANTERNALRQLDPTSPDYESQLFRVNPTMGIAYRKEAATAAAQQATQKAQQAEALKTNLANHRSFLVGVNDQTSYDAWRALTTKNIPELEKILPPVFSPETKDGLLKTADDMSKRLTAAPPAPPASVAEFERAKTDPKFMQFLQQRAAAGRPPRPEAAPRTQQVTLSDGSLGIMNMDTGAITPATLGGEGVKGKDSTKTAVSEQQAAYNIGRVLTAANEIKNITKKSPSAVQPGAMEAFASSLGMGGTANLSRSADRQIVQGAQRDALDALLYLATGAAYNKEQLQGQMDAYIPSFTDTDEAVAAKKSRMTELIKSAKTRAGKSWTPEMDKAMTALTGADTPAAAAPAAAAPAPAAASNIVVTPDGQSHTFPTPAAAAQFKKAAGIK